MHPVRLIMMFAFFVLCAPADVFGTASRHAVEAMVRDVDHLIQTTEQTRWHIDAEELASLQTEILLIICASTDSLRQDTHTFLTERKAKHGDLKTLWIKHDKELEEIETPLRHHRALKLFQSGLKRAPTECPFWMPQETEYIEQHRPTRQWFFGFDGGGMFNILPRGNPLRFGFGGSSRVSAGYGIDENWIVRVGVEVGGAGLLDREIETEDVDVQFFGGAPVAVKKLWQIWFLESDLGPIAVGVPWKKKPDIGGRTSFMIGIVSSRLGDFQPWAGARISTDYIPSRGSDNGFVLRTGLRFGIDYRL